MKRSKQTVLHLLNNEDVIVGVICQHLCVKQDCVLALCFCNLDGGASFLVSCVWRHQITVTRVFFVCFQADEPATATPLPPDANQPAEPSNSDFVPNELNGEQAPEKRIETDGDSISITAVLVPVLLIVGIVGIGAIIVIARRHRHSRSHYGDGGSDLDPNITLNDLLRSGWSNFPRKDGLKPDDLRGSLSVASFSLDAGPVYPSTLSNTSSSFKLSPRPSELQWSPPESSECHRELSLSLSSAATSVQEEERRAWDAFMAHTRRKTVDGTLRRQTHWGQYGVEGEGRDGRRLSEGRRASIPEVFDCAGRLRKLRQ